MAPIIHIFYWLISPIAHKPPFYDMESKPAAGDLKGSSAGKETADEVAER